jgi:hypothetical protein
MEDTTKEDTETDKSANWALTVMPVMAGEPPIVHKFVAHVGSVLILKTPFCIGCPGSLGQANTPLPDCETENSVAQLVMATGAVHPPHVACAPVPWVKMSLVRGASVPNATVTWWVVAVIDVGATGVPPAVKVQVPVQVLLVLIAKEFEVRGAHA